MDSEPLHLHGSSLPLLSYAVHLHRLTAHLHRWTVHLPRLTLRLPRLPHRSAAFSFRFAALRLSLCCLRASLCRVLASLCCVGASLCRVPASLCCVALIALLRSRRRLLRFALRLREGSASVEGIRLSSATISLRWQAMHADFCAGSHSSSCPFSAVAAEALSEGSLTGIQRYRKRRQAARTPKRCGA
jgi:hypothetical protein